MGVGEIKCTKIVYNKNEENANVCEGGRAIRILPEAPGAYVWVRHFRDL